MSVMRPLRDALDRLALYLPLLVMALLAMGSWWLLRLMPAVWEGGAEKPLRKDPDYHLAHFTTQAFDANGRRVREVGGESARHFPDTDELHIDNVYFSALNEAGVEVTGTARQGIASGDGERVTLIGAVHVVSPAHGTTPKMEFRSERLVAWIKTQKLRSDERVEIWRDRDKFDALGLDFDMKTGQYQLSGRVHGVLQPQTTPGR